MKQAAAHFQVPTEVGTARPMARNVEQAWINSRIHAEILDLGLHLGWHGGYRIDQLICRETDDGWSILVKATKKGKCWVAYINAETLPEAFELAGEFAARGVLEFKVDRWPSKQARALTGEF